MAFQNLINSVFQGGPEEFQAIAPWGNKGDGGNDGYIQSTGHYLQVYGPKLALLGRQLQPPKKQKTISKNFRENGKNCSDTASF